jgi:uncharacterized membrane protein
MDGNKNNNNMSKHILPTSANLLGICFAILTFIKVSPACGADTAIAIDELIGVAIILFLSSCTFSYTSMRFLKKSETYEQIADAIFMFGLCILGLTTILTLFFKI